MQQAEEQRRSRSENKKGYYQQLKERAAQGDTSAQEILERQRAAVRANVKRWIEDHPELRKQYRQKIESSDRYRAYKREYMRQWRARKKKQ